MDQSFLSYNEILTISNNLSSYSNYNGPIDIAAPGDNILSAYLNNTYKTMSGTSMAAPQVSAALAIIRSVFSEKTCVEAEEYLEEYAIEIEENDLITRWNEEKNIKKQFK